MFRRGLKISILIVMVIMLVSVMIPFTAFGADNNHNDPDAFFHEVRPDYIGTQNGVVCKGLDEFLRKQDIKRQKLDNKFQDIKGDLRSTKQQSEYEDWFSFTLKKNDDGDDTYTIELGPGRYEDSNIISVDLEDEYQEYPSKITRAIVNEGVTGIGDYCFTGFDALESVKLPQTLSVIGSSAFYYCYSLTSINIPPSVTEIGEEAFYCCGPNPANIEFPESFTALEKARAIYDNHFENYVDPSAPSETSYLDQFDESYEIISEIVSNLNLEGKNDYQKIKAIYDWITTNVVYDYEALEYDNDRSNPRFCYAATAHSAITKHMAICSGYSDLTKIMMNEAGIGCFLCSGGDHTWPIVELDGNWYAIDPTWDAGVKDYFYKYFLMSYDSFTTDYHEYPYYRSAHTWDIDNIFYIKYEISNTDYCTFSEEYYDYLLCGDYVVITKYNGNSEELTLPESVEFRNNTYPVAMIGVGSFYNNDSLISLSIPEGYIHICEGALLQCSNLNTLRLPSTLKIIESYVFFNTPIKNVIYAGTAEQFKEIEVADVFFDNYNLSNVDVQCTDKLFDTLEWEGYNYYSEDKYDYKIYDSHAGILKYKGKETTITLPVSISIGDEDYKITCIGEDAFNENTELKTLIIPEGYNAIYDYAFAWCNSLKNVSLPLTLKRIGNRVFYMLNLTNVKYAGTVEDFKEIEIEEFEYSNNDLFVCDIECLDYYYNPSENVTFTVYSDAPYEFKVFDDHTCIMNYSGINSKISLPKAVTIDNKNLPITTICKKAFRFNKSLESIIIPEGYEYIFDEAFESCINLSELTIPSTLKEIGEYAFDCLDLTKVVYNGTVDQFKKIKIAEGNYDLKKASVICSDGTYNNPFNIEKAKVKFSPKSFIYNDKIQTPSVTITSLSGKTLKEKQDYILYFNDNRTAKTKNVGKYSISIEGVGDYFGYMYFAGAYKINPMGTTLKSLIAVNKGFNAKWIKQSTKMSASRITGYQIQIATNSKFTKGKKLITVKGYSTVSKKITGLKAKKTYYARIRTYKTVNGEKYYSKWSKMKSVKTKG